MKNRLALLIATWFGAGYSPVAPGTAGSLAAIAIAWVLGELAGWRPLWIAALAVALTPAAVWASGVTAQLRKTEDPALVVVDEVAGQWLAFSGAAWLGWKTYLGAFLLFRAFDIWKPGPVRHLERLPGGIGIVADDLGAGACAALVLFWAGWFNLY